MAGNEKQMETIMPQDNRAEATEVLAFLGVLSQREKERFLDFIQGARTMKSLIEEATRTA